MRRFSQRERQEADLFYADLMGRPGPAATAAAATPAADRSDILERDGAGDVQRNGR